MWDAAKLPTKARLANCDGTDAARGVLASIVFVSHYVHFFVGDFYPLSVAGSLAVLFFFAISGFVISSSLLRHTAPGGAVDLVSFAKRRFFRIVPPLMATYLFIKMLEVVLVFSGIVGADREAAGIYGYHLNLFKAAVSLLSLGAINDLGGGLDGPLWSLAYEIRCYVTAALVAWLLTSRSSIERKAIVVLLLLAYWYVALFIKSEGPIAQLPWLLSFAAGFFAFRYRDAIASKGRSIVALAVAFSAGACLALSFFEQLPPVEVVLLQCLCGCAFAILVFALHGVAVRSWLLTALGGISYTLYIAHFPILLAFYLAIKSFSSAVYIPLAAVAGIAALLICFALGRTMERSSAQLAWTERQLSRLRGVAAVRTPVR